MSNNKLNYVPQVFLRCHCKDNDRFDNSTNVWRVSFHPQSETLVSTCGGNTVCVIDCESKRVVARYIDQDEKEMLEAMAWGSNIGENVVLAVAGIGLKIIILNVPSLQVKAIIPSAHSKHINSLLYLPTNHLVSCSYDGWIKIWDSKNNNKKYECVHRVDTRLQLLNVLLCDDTLIVSAEDGLLFWQSPLTHKERFTRASLPKNGCHVDGMAMIDSERIVIRQKKRDSLSVINVKKTMLSQESEVELIREAELEWSKTDIDYFNLCCVEDLLACGDDDGSIWLYSVSNQWRKVGKKKEITSIEADLVLKWPDIEQEEYLVDKKKVVLINDVALSGDKTYLVAATNNNLVCIWKTNNNSKTNNKKKKVK